MSENDAPGSDEPADRSGNGVSQASLLLKKIGETLVPILVTAGSLIGFVAFAGAVIVWTRFYALEVPPDQAVKAVPRSELVATGSSLLLLFGFFGALAVLATYLVDRGGRATPRMLRALVGLAAVESGVAIAIVAGVDGSRREIAAALLLLSALVAFGATFRHPFVRFEDSNPPHGDEKQGPIPNGGLFLDSRGKLRVPPLRLLEIGALAVLVAALAGLPWLLGLSWALRILGTVAAIAVVVIARNQVREVGDKIVEGVEKEEDADSARRRRERRQRRGKGGSDAEAKRFAGHRPYRLIVTTWGGLLATVAIAFATVVPALVVHEWWMAVSVGAAAVLGFGLWRIAGLSKSGFMWFGLAVFLSVPLFGTLTLMARNLADPQVQPVAIIRSTDGPDESIQGLYVAEGSDRVYFANVATEGCGQKVRQDSGRLLWVPKDEVVAMSIGPLQDVADAGRAALEMAYALTPDVETPVGDSVSLNPAEQRAQPGPPAGEAKTGSAEEATGGNGLDQRLESPGPAVRPNFGSGLTLVPETASAGQEVELRLSVPNENLEAPGFGPSPEGHILRVGGVPVSVLRIGTRQGYDAEYVKTTDGRVLSLDKRGVYRLDDGDPELLAEEGHEGRRFVKLEDSTIESIHGGRRGHPEFLRIVGNEHSVRLAGHPEVKLLGGDEFIPLEPHFLRQAWEEDRIRFRVPKNASTGVVSLDCGQLASQPLLRVSRPPTARIAVHMLAGSRKIRFDSRRSSDHGKIVSRRWSVGALSRGKGRQISRSLPPRIAPYRVQLSVTGADGETDTAELRLLRLPASHFRFGDTNPEHEKLVKRIRKAVVRQASEEPPANIEIDGDADDVGSKSFNLELSWERALSVRKALVKTQRGTTASASIPPVPVKTRGFGESCPVKRGSGRSRQNRRVEIFVLGAGTRVVFPSRCHPGRTAHTTW